MARHGYKRSDVHPVPGGPYVVSCYCLCGLSFGYQDYSMRNAERGARDKLSAHVRKVEKNLKNT